MLMMLVTVTLEAEPMFCPTQNAAVIYKIPEPIPCHDETPSIVNVTMMKRNVKTYKSKVVSLEIVDKVCKATYHPFFAKTQEKWVEKVILPPTLYRDFLSRDYCLSEDGKMTEHLPVVRETRCAFKWPTTTITKVRNCYKQEGIITAVHSGKYTFSTLANAAKCSYQEGQCGPIHGRMLFWDPDPHQKEEYIPVGTFKGLRIGTHLLIKDLSLSLNLQNMVTNDNTTYTSTAFKTVILAESKDQKEVSKVKRDIAEQIQMLEEEISKKFNYVLDLMSSPITALSNVCSLITQLAKTTKVLASQAPTALMRVLLKQQYLVAEELIDNYEGSQCHVQDRYKQRLLHTSTNLVHYKQRGDAGSVP